jgi:hypothetical protein
MKAVFLCCVLWFALPTLAQARTLHWSSLTVHVQIDEEGALHITERHAMVFDGDWNGGERIFQLRSWHDLDVASVTEIEPDSGARIRLREGDLDAVNEYKLARGHVLRWRSRLPSDPPFDHALKVYEVAYTLEGALLPQGASYKLNHDLAFPDRSGEIERFDATLDFAPEWQVPDVPRTIHREHVQPGESVFVSTRLRYVGSGTPSAVASVGSIASTTSLPWLRYAAVAIVLVFAALSVRDWLRSERALGRFEPHIPLDSIDEQWLTENVFVLKPEVVGATWDRNTSAAEVAALLARLTLEGKLASSVKRRGWGPFQREILHLTMLCERSAFQSYERRLIDKLFFDDSRQTDTDAIRSHYKNKGFNPAQELDARLRKRAPSVFAADFSLARWRAWLTAGLFVGGGTLMAIGWLRTPDTIWPTAMPLVAFLIVYAIGLAYAYGYSEHVHDLRPRLIRALLAPTVICAGLAYVLLGSPFPLVALQLVAFPVLVLAFLNSVFNRMHSREMPKGMQLRRTLGSARKYFERELAAEQPRLKDEWFPYLLAFGLGPTVDRWFKAFGGATRSDRQDFGTSSTAIDMSRGGGSSTWTGGGGAFSGAGASGSWAAAAAGVAAGVPAASSSGGSGGGGGGGSSSSGGGGGGGW